MNEHGSPRFGRVLTAMVTPFTDDGALDLDGAQELAKYLVEHGNDGVIVAGTTGESATLTIEEQLHLIRAVREAIPDHHLIAGAGSNDTRSAMANTEKATQAGADAILSVTPYYNRPSQAGLDAHFRAVASATDLPIVIYDIPVRTGRKVSTETLLELFEVDNIVAVKDAAGSPAATADLMRRAPDEIDLYSGDDSLTLPFMAVGGCGVIGVATHWIGAEMNEMISAFFDGRVTDARDLNARLIPSFSFETTDDALNPQPTKTMLGLLGLPAGPCRAPMGFPPPDLVDRARAVLDELGRCV